ncbi:MAG: hypothetical protein K6E13_04015 [Lachnospiraceae bacterium]|nr:hypothetical protein [Lachnospiraceae bacterium]
MEDYRNQLEMQLDQLNYMIALVEKSLKRQRKYKKEKICVSVRKKGFQYYKVNDKAKRVYIKKENLSIVGREFQREYDEEVYRIMTKIRSRLERFLKLYDYGEVENVYKRLPNARKDFVRPIISTIEDYIEEWYEVHRGNQNTYPNTKGYLTERGEYVRSKSEKIIADIFNKYDIPYCYEPSFEMENGRYCYPDFAVLDKKRRKTVYWEHFGLITDGEYATGALLKMNEYERSGLVIGDDILYSMESDTMPLNVKMLEKKIVKYLVQ